MKTIMIMVGNAKRRRDGKRKSCAIELFDIKPPFWIWCEMCWRDALREPPHKRGVGNGDGAGLSKGQRV